MSAAKLPMLLDPARTDADWVTDLTFFIDSEATPEDWSGCSASLALVPRSVVQRSDSFLLTSDVGGGLVMLANGVGIRVDDAVMATIAPTKYDFELRKHDGEAIEAVLVGSVSIEQGLAPIAEGQTITSAVALSGGQGGVKVIRSAVPPRVVRGGGARGPAGVGVPPGGLVGQILVKLSDNDFDTAWVDPPVGPPPSPDGSLDFSDPGNPLSIVI